MFNVKKVLFSLATMASATAIMVVGGTNASAATEGAFTYTIVDGGAKITAYAMGGSFVDIPDTLGGEPVTAIGDFVFSGRSIPGVDIPDTVTSIGDQTFTGNRLSSIELPSNLKSIGVHAFSNNALTAVSIPDGVTAIGSSAFTMNQLTSAVLPKNLTTIGNTVFQSNRLTNITIPDGVVSIGASAFADNQLTAVSIPDQVGTLGTFAFANNPLQSVHLGAKVDYIPSSAFNNAPVSTYTVSASNATFRDIDGKGIYDKSGTILKRGTTQGFIAPTTAVIDTGAFKNVGLSSITVPEHVIMIGPEAFASNNFGAVTVLNNSIDIQSNAFSLNPAGTVLRGQKGSSIETFATANGFNFQAIGQAEASPSGSSSNIDANVRVIAGELYFENEAISLASDTVSLNGRSQVVSALFNNTADVIDARGTHTGYDIQMAMTDLVSDNNIIGKENITFKGLNSISADGISGPVDEMSAASSFSLVNFGEGKGIGKHNLDFSGAIMDVFLSEKTKAGTYEGVIQLSLVTSP